MFFKKNKSNDTPLDPNHPSAAHRDPMDGPSLFAPGLNPNAQPIDFGFGRIPTPPNYAYPQSSLAPEVMPPVQPFETSGWAPQFEASDPGFEAQPMPELLNDAELSAAAPSAEGDAPLLEQPMPSGTGSSYLGETFENYTPNPLTEPLSDSTENLGWELPAEPAMNAELNTEFNTWNSGLETQSWASEAPPGDAEMAYPPSSAIESQSDWAMPSEGVLEASLDSGMGDLMPWEQLPDNPTNAQVSPSPEALWEQFDSGATLPGEQVPMASGAFLDSVHEKLYPEDPFAPGYDDLVEGQHAFEEAAQFLFPDTVSAPLDWQPDAYPSEGIDPFTAQTLSLDNAALIEPPLELGPSVQSDVSEVSDMTAYAAEMLQTHLPPSQPSGAAPSAGDSWLVDDPLEAFGTFDSSATPSLSSPENFGLEGPSSTHTDLTGFDFSNSGFESSSTGFEAPEIPLEGVPSEVPLTSFDPLGPEALDFDPFTVPLTASAEPLGAGFNQFEPSDSAFELPVSDLEAQSQQSVDIWPSGQQTPETLMGPSLVEPDGLDFDPFTPLSTESAALEAPQGMLESSAVSMDDAGILWPGEANADMAVSDQGFSGEDASLAFQSWEMPEAALGQSDEAYTVPLPELSDVDAVGEPTLLELSDQDFYATEFTLNEFGELVPVDPTEAGVSLTLEPAFEAPGLPEAPPTTLDFAVEPVAETPGLPEVPPTSFEFEVESVFETPELPEVFSLTQAAGNSSDSQLFAEEEAFQSPVEQLPTEAVSPFQQVALPPIPIMPAPLPVEEAQVPEEHPPLPEYSGPLEAQWHDTSSDVTMSAIQPSQVAPPDEFLLSDIQILAVCPLFGDRRLLVVSSNGMYALMGQVGLQQPQIAVLKLFDHNPLAYQNTFTAVAEAHADSQGMFVTQVGTWRGIISTFQDKITLHTDLG